MPSPSVTQTLYAMIAERLEQLIHTGTLRPGERVPSVRRTCTQHGVSLTTAVQAYRLLENRGFIEGRPRSGFFVRPQAGIPAQEPQPSRPTATIQPVTVGALQARIFDAARVASVVPLGAAYPGAANLPVAKLSRIMSVVARQAGAAGINYDMPPGAEKLRRQIARRTLDCGLNLSPEDIITTCGGTEALALCLQAVARPGDVVAVESPTYFGVLQQIQSLGLKAVEIPMHPRDGMDLDGLEHCLKKCRIAACLAVPNFSNPLGSLMPEENKRRLVDILARRDVPLIEDDVNGSLSHENARPRVAKSYDRHGRVLLCSSFSKTIAPGYRVGWVAPGRYFDRVKLLKSTGTLATASLPQLAMAEFMANGGYDHHLRTLRKRFSAQVAQMSRAVTEMFPAGIKLTRPAGGFVLWVELPKKAPALKLHDLALAEKISIAPGPMFSANQGFKNFIRLNCGHPWSPETERAVGTLGRLVRRLM